MFLAGSHNQSLPLLLVLALQLVHPPLHKSKAKYSKLYKDLDKRGFKQRAQLLAMVSAMDSMVGETVAALEEAGMWRDTLLVFLSDNGARVSKAGSNWPLRGGKHTLYEVSS